VTPSRAERRECLRCSTADFTHSCAGDLDWWDMFFAFEAGEGLFGGGAGAVGIAVAFPRVEVVNHNCPRAGRKPRPRRSAAPERSRRPGHGPERHLGAAASAGVPHLSC
jgi:hypothetical protein